MPLPPDKEKQPTESSSSGCTPVLLHQKGAFNHASRVCVEVVSTEAEKGLWAIAPSERSREIGPGRHSPL